MTKTTSLELSKKLYEAFGWETGSTGFNYVSEETLVFGWSTGAIPAYTTDFLLDKLPKEIKSGTLELVAYADHWEAAYSDARGALWDTNIGSHASKVPAEALGNLALALKEKGLLNE